MSGSGNPPAIVLLSSTSTSSSPSSMINTSNQPGLSHSNNRPSIVVHPQTLSSASSSSTIPFRSVIVKPYRDSIQQALSTGNSDVKPLLIQPTDSSEMHPPNKRMAVDSADLNNPNLTFSMVSKAEVLTALQPVQSTGSVPIATMISHSPSAATNTSYSTLRLVAPSGFVNANEISTLPTSGQSVLLQQHGNLVITQPVVTLQLQSDQTNFQKENNLQTTYQTLDSSATTPRTTNADHFPIQYQRKPCNCTKSMCLKLYCDCFANGLNCQNCACLNCHNDARHEEERNRAIAATLERNPNAFKSKMYKFGSCVFLLDRIEPDIFNNYDFSVRIASTTVAQPDRPLKGCNCKKSSCHKRYCECYESRVPCTSLCKCIGCKNTESTVHPSNVGFYRTGEPKTTNQTALDQIPRTGPPVESTVPHNVFNMEVTEALTSCLLATAQQCEMNQMNDHDSQEALLKEFQRCMHQIVQSALGRSTSSTSSV